MTKAWGGIWDFIPNKEAAGLILIVVIVLLQMVHYVAMERGIKRAKHMLSGKNYSH